MAEHVNVSALMSAMEELAPTRFAEPWDNVGLLLGSASEHLRGPVLLCIDLTHAVLDEASTVGSSAIVCYHPPLFAPIKRLTSADARQALFLRAAREGIALYSPHTALDAAPQGMADWLADCCMEQGQPEHADRRALLPSAVQDEHQQLKIVTYVPLADVERVRNALATAGAGRIGEYEVCSFSMEGTGTFLGSSNTKPRVGSAEQLSHISECRLEMVCPKRALAIALATLREFHPYEEPAIDVIVLHPQPRRQIGVGRRLVLDKPVALRKLAMRLKVALGVRHVEVATAADSAAADDTAGDANITCIGVCPGSGGELVDAAIAEQCQVLVTGEMKHHDVLAANMRGLSVILAGHTRTERPYLAVLRDRLAERMGPVQVLVSNADCDVLRTE